MRVPRETRRCRAVAPSLTAEGARRIFQVLAAEGIPLEHSVPFLVRARGWELQTFCHEVGVHRGYFHALLQRRYNATLPLRLAVHRRIGFDPWHVTATVT